MRASQRRVLSFLALLACPAVAAAAARPSSHPPGAGIVARADGGAAATRRAPVANCWSPWYGIGNDVSVSVCQVSSDTWTWKFRNDGSTTITYMTFGYTDKDGDHPDILPGSLRPGAVIGGWAAFTASSRPTRIWIKEIQRG